MRGLELRTPAIFFQPISSSDAARSPELPPRRVRTGKAQKLVRIAGPQRPLQAATHGTSGRGFTAVKHVVRPWGWSQ